MARIEQFQFTLPRGERLTSAFLRICHSRGFNSRSREGSDWCLMDRTQVSLRFQFTLPRGERRLGACARYHRGRRFNSRSREGSDSPGGRSYHGASRCFNSRSREGSDGKYAFTINPDVGVSIHAPARGATKISDFSHSSVWFQFTLPRGERPLGDSWMLYKFEFQFTLPRGERPTRASSIHHFLTFQFTLPRGERPRLPKNLSGFL